jgi:ribonuclease P protein component
VQKENRLTRREDFNKVYRYGKSAANHQFVVYVMNRHSASAGDGFRLGISVSKKVGNAVVRNRLRRRIKEIVRLNREKLVLKKDFILIVRKPAADLEYADMEKSILHVLKRAELLVKKGQPSG